MMQNDEQTPDLRDRVEAYLGKPLAASARAGLWRCPVCPPKRHALLMVSATEYQCLSGSPCDGGAGTWLHSHVQSADERFVVGAHV